MSIAYQSDRALVWQGDSLELMRSLPDGCMDSVVTDPPYNLSFMGRKWDTIDGSFQHWCEEWARECLRLLKPGGHLLAFGGTRTWHRLAAGIEDAGFELRDSIAWMHGQGFPKSKALLKPAFEPIVFARKPGPLQFLNIDDCRIGMSEADAERIANMGGFGKDGWSSPGGIYNTNDLNNAMVRTQAQAHQQGRWPANVVLDVGQAAALDAQSGDRRSAGDYPSEAKTTSDLFGKRTQGQLYADSGGASRFFYVAKASSKERPKVEGAAHPTVKPLKLMRWLVRLVTPEGGTVLDPFAGSGTTVEACLLEGFRCMGMEREDDYVPLILHRIERSVKP